MLFDAAPVLMLSQTIHKLSPFRNLYLP